MKDKDLSLIGARIAASDIRVWARVAAEGGRPDIKALILDALRDGLKVLEEERES